MNRTDRNAAQIARDSIAEEVLDDGDFTAAQNWSPVAKQMRFRFKGKEMNDPEHWKGVDVPQYRAILEIRATLAPGEGVCYFDDVQLVPLTGQQ